MNAPRTQKHRRTQLQVGAKPEQTRGVTDDQCSCGGMKRTKKYTLLHCCRGTVKAAISRLAFRSIGCRTSRIDYHALVCGLHADGSCCCFLDFTVKRPTRLKTATGAPCPTSVLLWKPSIQWGTRLKNPLEQANFTALTSVPPYQIVYRVGFRIGRILI